MLTSLRNKTNGASILLGVGEYFGQTRAFAYGCGRAEIGRMIQSTRFALARYAPRMMRQKGEILEFHAEGIRVWAGDKILEEWPYSTVRRLLYKHFPGSLSRTFQFMSGNLLQRRDAVFSIEMEGGRKEFYLEADAEFRQSELRDVMRDLYLAGVNLEEYSGTGNRMFLLESANEIEIEAAVAALFEKENSDE